MRAGLRARDRETLLPSARREEWGPGEGVDNH
jgi:hypothetical protein